MTLELVLQWESRGCYSRRGVTEVKVRAVGIASATSKAGRLIQVGLELGGNRMEVFGIVASVAIGVVGFLL